MCTVMHHLSYAMIQIFLLVAKVQITHITAIPSPRTPLTIHMNPMVMQSLKLLLVYIFSCGFKNPIKKRDVFSIRIGACGS